MQDLCRTSDLGFGLVNAGSSGGELCDGRWASVQSDCGEGEETERDPESKRKREIEKFSSVNVRRDVY